VLRPLNVFQADNTVQCKGAQTQLCESELFCFLNHLERIGHGKFQSPVTDAANAPVANVRAPNLPAANFFGAFSQALKRSASATSRRLPDAISRAPTTRAILRAGELPRVGQSTKRGNIVTKFFHPFNSFSRHSVDEYGPSACPIVIDNVPNANNERENNAKRIEPVFHKFPQFSLSCFDSQVAQVRRYK